MLGLEQLELAMSAFQAAIRQDPNFADPYLAMGGRSGSWAGCRKPRTPIANFCALCRAMWTAISPSARFWRKAGNSRKPRRRCGGRLIHTQDAKVLASIHNNLAIALSSQSKHAEALESLERTRTLAPELRGLDQRRINALYQLGRFEECLLLYKKLLERNPADPEVHQAYNSLLYRLGRKDEYLTSYDQAPQTREILLGKARQLSLQKRCAEMEEIFNTLLARDPLDSAAMAGWASSLMLMGRYRKL